MKIAVVGTGYVGLVTGTCFAEMGNDVVCVDIDEGKVERLRSGRLTIFELYEQNVGLLTPLLVEELREAAESYPPEWIEEAFREAVGYNRRNWRYVRRILENWATQGRGERGAAGGRPQSPRDPRRYLEGQYGHLVQH